ncbi:hypothetical protein BT63DRAFT_222966 [Microthyrium microscopicum]|uniref:CCR4-NOT transcription complex subunit 11 n=1 Tax=Microthyrium microscopicum TaxID=703497 RepID=A0A6A6UFG9_9PEZI|nr:hypothetical protein BT63DRAFT_222966 [Microthyrium microscopicum]
MDRASNADILREYNIQPDQLAILSRSIDIPFQSTYDNLTASFKELGLTTFISAFQIRALLDHLESKKEHNGTPSASETYTSVVLSAEYYLVCASYKAEPGCTDGIHYNPFLAHWVAFVDRCMEFAYTTPEENKILGLPDWWVRTHRARMLIALNALQETTMGHADRLSPRQFEEDASHESLKNVDLQFLGPLINILETNGLRGNPSELLAKGEHTTPPQNTAKSSTTAQPTLDTNEKTKSTTSDNSAHDGSSNVIDSSFLESINTASSGTSFVADYETYLRNSPSEALYDLIRLPPTLHNLDLVTTVITKASMRNILAALDFDPSNIGREYLQQALLALEKSVAASGLGGPVQAPESDVPSPTGPQIMSKDEVARSATLLTVFLRNVLTRGALRYEEVELDIKELCVRYIWVAEVREFSAWLAEVTQDGHDEDGGPQGQNHGLGG